MKREKPAVTTRCQTVLHLGYGNFNIFPEEADWRFRDIVVK